MQPSACCHIDTRGRTVSELGGAKGDAGQSSWPQSVLAAATPRLGSGK